MSFWSNPSKAFKGAINNYVPGGRQLTGDAQRRQKRLYNEAQGNYDNYAKEAQQQVEELSKQLLQSKSDLQSLQQVRYQNQYKGQQLQSELGNYAQGLQRLESKKAQLGNEAQSLQSSFSDFQSKIPDLEGGISEMQQLPAEFDLLFNSVREQKESLQGLSGEEAGRQIKAHKLNVENLKQSRIDTENKIKEHLSTVTDKHKGLTRDQQNLETKLDSYRAKQEALEQNSNDVDGQRSRMQQMLSEYKNEASSINSRYESSRSKFDNLSNQLSSYSKDAQNRLDELGGHLEWRGGKYSKEASRTGIVQGLGLAALTFGAGMGLEALGGAGTGAGAAGTGAAEGAATPSLGSSILSSIGSGLKYAAPLVGMMKYSNTANIQHNLKNIEPANLENIMADLQGNYSLQQQKMSIPELGGLKQSLSHFNMPSVPKLADLPTLSDSLGKIVSAKDIEGLSLGLPQMTSASGKKYSSAVLYDSNFLKKLKKLSKRIGTPYLNSEILKGKREGVVYG